jgi:hypothetical protein
MVNSKNILLRKTWIGLAITIAGRPFRTRLASRALGLLCLRAAVPSMNEFETVVLSVLKGRFSAARLPNDFDRPVPSVPHRYDAQRAA